MSEKQSPEPPKTGEICWVEIPATNMERAQKFYTTVFGWEFTTPTNVTMPKPGCYSIFSKPDTKLHGGMPLVKEDELIRPKVDAEGEGMGQMTNRLVMAVEDVVEALKSIKAAGGEVLGEKREIGEGMGYTGRFRDTEGNVNGVWSMK